LLTLGTTVMIRQGVAAIFARTWRRSSAWQLSLRPGSCPVMAPSSSGRWNSLPVSRSIDASARRRLACLADRRHRRPDAMVDRIYPEFGSSRATCARLRWKRISPDQTGIKA